MLRKAAELAAAVAPAKLDEVLDSLVEGGLIEGWAYEGDQVRLDGDLVRLEAARMFARETPLVVPDCRPSDNPEQDAALPMGVHITRLDDRGYRRDRQGNVGRAEYYAAAQDYLRRHRWKNKLDREVWKMHADGETTTAICRELNISRKKVRWFLFRQQQKAGLPTMDPSHY